MRNLPSSLSLSRSLMRSARPPSGYHLNSAHAPRTNLDQDHSSVYLSISAPSGAAYLGSEFLHFQFTVGMLFNVKLADQTKNKSTSLSEAVIGIHNKYRSFEIIKSCLEPIYNWRQSAKEEKRLPR